MVMSIDTQYGMLFKFMNQSRSNYISANWLNIVFISIYGYE